MLMNSFHIYFIFIKWLIVFNRFMLWIVFNLLTALGSLICEECHNDWFGLYKMQMAKVLFKKGNVIVKIKEQAMHF